MSLVVNVGSLVNVGGGLLLLAFAVFVARLRPRTRASVAFAAFSAAWGVVPTFFYSFTRDDALFGLAGIAALVAAVALIAVALLFPAPLAPGERRLLVVPAATAVAFGLGTNAFFWADWGTYASFWVPAGGSAVPWSVWTVGFAAVISAHLFALFLLALRFARKDGDDARRRQGAILTAALALYPGVAYGALYYAPDGISARVAPILVALLGVVAALWLRSAARGLLPRVARNAALVVLAAPLTGLGVSAAVGGISAVLQGGVFAALRTLVVLIVGYAIVRHHLFGVDVKVRWTIKQSTIAAAFIGLFFVASEGAQVLFSESAGPFVGIVAAGALVFAMAPLQRVAERVANTALPAADGPRDARTGKEDAFRDALRIALRDHRITREEEARLAKLADHLGIPASRVLEMLGEAEREAAGTEDIQVHPSKARGRVAR